MAKAVCPFTADEWVKAGSTVPVKLVIGTQEYPLTPKVFDSGSLGYGLNTRTPMTVEGKTFDLLINASPTIAGSKPATPPAK